MRRAGMRGVGSSYASVSKAITEFFFQDKRRGIRSANVRMCECENARAGCSFYFMEGGRRELELVAQWALVRFVG